MILMLGWGVLVVMLGVTQASAQGLSKEQGDEILKELRQIRMLLQQQQAGVQPTKPMPSPTPPQPMPVSHAKVSVKGSPFLGRKDAPLTLVEFTDFQCPYCKRFHDQTFGELKKAYIDTGKLRFVTRNLALPIHPYAEGAALAAACAREQGENKYWELREVLFRHSPALKPEQIQAYAKGIGLGMLRFRRCVMSRRYMKTIRQDAAAARSAGITGTPSFILGKGSGDIVEGEAITGAQPFAVFDARIKALLSSPR